MAVIRTVIGNRKPDRLLFIANVMIYFKSSSEFCYRRTVIFLELIFSTAFSKLININFAILAFFSGCSVYLTNVRT